MYNSLLQNPKWDPPTVEDVNIADVESVFEPLAPENELNVWFVRWSRAMKVNNEQKGKKKRRERKKKSTMDCLVKLH